MSHDIVTTAEIIATQNDAFRGSIYGLSGPYPGKWVMSHDVSARGAGFCHSATVAVATFAAFDAHNDPYCERDFGAFELNGEKLFFKIDYYDLEYRYGSEDPSDPAQTRRVLTIYFPHEH